MLNMHSRPSLLDEPIILRMYEMKDMRQVDVHTYTDVRVRSEART